MTIELDFGPRYTTIREIGRGGMGVVLEVTDEDTSDRCALKYCLADDEDARRRFSREVRTIASIQHTHVMPVLDQNLKNDPPYFTMPLAKHSLADEIGDIVKSCV